MEAWPKRVPDLYHGEPIIIAAKTSSAGEKVTIKGMRSLAPWQATLDISQGHSGDGIGVFWARSKIAALMDSLHDGADKDKVRKDVINVALTHHLVSRYTSLVAVDRTPSRLPSEELEFEHIPSLLPAGSGMATGFSKTATGWVVQLVLGLLCLGAASTMLLYLPPRPVTPGSDPRSPMTPSSA